MIRVGILGAGTIAQVSHIPMRRNLAADFEIEAVYDLSPGLSALVQKKFNIPRVYDSAGALIASKNIDAVFVLVPDPMHCALALAAIEAGKHVFIEKPLAMNAADIRRLMDAEAKHPECTVMVGYMRRFASSFLKAKELLETDRRPVEYIRFRDIILEGRYFIGQTTNVIRAKNQSDYPQGAAEELARMKREQHSAGLGSDATEMQRNAYQMLLGLGCHTFSAVRELIGPPREVKTVLSSRNGTHFISLLQYDGFIGTYEMVNDQSVVQFDAAIEIFQGTRKLLIKYDTPYIRYLPYSLEVVESTGENSKTTTCGPDYRDAFETELTYFASCIANKKKPKTSLADSLEDIELFQKMALMVQKEG
jgi:predicted dehydrogenase